MGGLSVERVVRRSLRAQALTRPASSISEAIVAAAGIYGTAPTSHLGLAARLEGYLPAMLERERLETRSILRIPGMRGSVFLAPRELVPACLGLSRPRTARRALVNDGVAKAELDRLMDRLEVVLASRSFTARELRERLGPDDPGGPRMTLLLRAMVGEGRAVAAEPVGGERATVYRYASMALWVPELGPRLAVEDALAVMAPIWMRANGPGTVADLAWWAGVTKTLAQAELRRMGARAVRIDGLDGEQWATDGIIDELVGRDTPSVITFLPAWDPWLMARRERSRILAEAHRHFVVDKSGNVTNTITLDGRIVGIWDIDGGVLLVHRFEQVDRAGLEEAATRLRSVLDWTEMRDARDPRPLDEGGQNAFRSPLRRRDSD